MKFCVIRHPDAGLGTCAETALEHHRANGWIRISDWRGEPSDFHMPDFAEAFDDLDPAPEPEAPAESAAEPEEPPTTRRSRSKEKQA